MALAATSKPGHREAEGRGYVQRLLGRNRKKHNSGKTKSAIPLQLTALSLKAHHLCRFIEDSVKK